MQRSTCSALALTLAALLGNIACAGRPAPEPAPERSAVASSASSPEIQAILRAPAGDVSLSILDYGRYIQAHLRGLRGRSDLLRSETYRFLHEPVGKNDQGTGYALGWGVADLEGVPTHGHSGSAGTFYARVAIQPTRDLAAAVVTNAGDEDAGAAVREALRALLGELSQ